MPKALTVTRDDFTAEGLREAAARSTDADAARRMLGLALVLDGYQRGEAANLMDPSLAGLVGIGLNALDIDFVDNRGLRSVETAHCHDGAAYIRLLGHSVL